MDTDSCVFISTRMISAAVKYFPHNMSLFTLIVPGDVKMDVNEESSETLCSESAFSK